MSFFVRYLLAIPVTAVMSSAALAHPDITTHDGTLTYLIASVIGAALLLSAVFLNWLFSQRSGR